MLTGLDSWPRDIDGVPGSISESQDAWPKGKVSARNTKVSKVRNTDSEDAPDVVYRVQRDEPHAVKRCVDLERVAYHERVPRPVIRDRRESRCHALPGSSIFLSVPMHNCRRGRVLHETPRPRSESLATNYLIMNRRERHLAPASRSDSDRREDRLRLALLLFPFPFPVPVLVSPGPVLAAERHRYGYRVHAPSQGEWQSSESS